MSKQPSKLEIKNLEMIRAMMDHFGWEYTKEDKIEVTACTWKKKMRITFAGQIFITMTSNLKDFWAILEAEDYETLKNVFEDYENEKISHYPAATIIENSEVLNDPFYRLTGDDFINIDNLFINASKSASTNLECLAKSINAVSDKLVKDENFVKDSTAILTFLPEVNEDTTEFTLALALDKLPPFITCKEDSMVNRTPLNRDDYETYFGTETSTIIKQLDHISKLVNDALDKVNRGPYLVKYARSILLGGIVRIFLDHTVTLYPYGGETRIGLAGELTPASEACHKDLDKAIEMIFKYLEELDETHPMEGVDLYAMDIETMAIFGRTNENRTVGKSLGDESEKMINNFSKDFEVILKKRLKLIDNQRFFRAY